MGAAAEQRAIGNDQLPVTVHTAVRRRTDAEEHLTGVGEDKTSAGHHDPARAAPARSHDGVAEVHGAAENVELSVALSAYFVVEVRQRNERSVAGDVDHTTGAWGAADRETAAAREW